MLRSFHLSFTGEYFGEEWLNSRACAFFCFERSVCSLLLRKPWKQSWEQCQAQEALTSCFGDQLILPYSLTLRPDAYSVCWHMGRCFYLLTEANRWTLFCTDTFSRASYSSVPLQQHCQQPPLDKWTHLLIRAKSAGAGQRIEPVWF